VRRALAWALSIAAIGLAAASCNGTTGDELITFPAYAAGAKGAGDPFSVNGWTIQLTFAQMYIGAVYVDESPPGATFDTPVCTNPGVYAAQVPCGVQVNLLSTSPQPFMLPSNGTGPATQCFGNGTADLGLSWELWLVDGDVNDPDDTNATTPNIVDLQGSATRQSDGAVFQWAATVNVNQDNPGQRIGPVTDPSQPGLDPICKQRIVSEGGIALQLFGDGQLVVTVDPRGWFKLPIDFSSLPSVASDECELDQNSIYGDAQYCIPDTSFATGQGATAGANLFTGIQTGGPAAYSLAFTKAE
jgi:hypothetical protein